MVNTELPRTSPDTAPPSEVVGLISGLEVVMQYPIMLNDVVYFNDDKLHGLDKSYVWGKALDPNNPNTPLPTHGTPRYGTKRNGQFTLSFKDFRKFDAFLNQQTADGNEITEIQKENYDMLMATFANKLDPYYFTPTFYRVNQAALAINNEEIALGQRERFDLGTGNRLIEEESIFSLETIKRQAAIRRDKILHLYEEQERALEQNDPALA